MMNAVLTEEEHTGLDATLQGHYKKLEAGSFRLDVGSVGGFELQDVSGLKKARGMEQAQVKNLEAKAKALGEKFGDLDPEEAREAMRVLGEMGGLEGNEKLQKELAAKVEAAEKKFVADKKTLETGWAKTATEYEEANAALTTQLTKELISSEAVQAITSEGGSVKLLLPIVEKHCKVEKQDNGSFAVRIYDDEGVPFLSTKQGSTDPGTVVEYVSEMKKSKDYAPGFAGTNASGAGGGRAGQTRGPGGKTTITREQASSGDFIEELASGKVTVAEA